MEQKRRFSSRHIFQHLGLILILVALLLTGIAILQDFGESYDEEYAYNYALNSIPAYIGQGGKVHDDQGSIHIMVAKIGSDILRMIHPQWAPKEAWHLMHFLSFLIGVVFLYIICLRINNPVRPNGDTGIQPKTFSMQWGAIGAVLLFTTQPLLWGHAFINYKDVPFMAWFTGGIAFGMIMVDSLAISRSGEPGQDRPALLGCLRDEWKGMEKARKIWLTLLVAIAIGVWLVLLVATPVMNEIVASLVSQGFKSDPASLAGRLFSRLAERRGDIALEMYIRKAQALYGRFFVYYSLATLAVILLAWLKAFPETAKLVWSDRIKPFLYSFLSSIKNIWVIAAGIAFGISCSIRTAGPAVGFLIGCYLFMRLGKKAWPALCAYLLIGFLALYVTWPGLWGSPIKNYLASFSLSSDFTWEGKVMFAGTDYSPHDLPASYFPVLLSIQFTETTLLIFVIGAISLGIKIFRKRLDWRPVVVVLTWLLAPFLAAMIFQPTIYDNFRHFLFAVPPIFIIGSVGIQSLAERLKNRMLTVVLLAILLIPGILGIIRLHPYEYVYYNSIVGGTRGAFRNYEMDYWATSYRAATNYLNENAPPESTIIVWGPYWLVKNYARPDLEIIEYRQSDDVRDKANYVVLTSRHDKDLTLFATAELVYEIGRQEAVFAVVKRLNLSEAITK